jgi:hypothetical protein
LSNKIAKRYGPSGENTNVDSVLPSTWSSRDCRATCERWSQKCWGAIGICSWRLTDSVRSADVQFIRSLMHLHSSQCWSQFFDLSVTWSIYNCSIFKQYVTMWVESADCKTLCQM